MQYNMVILSYDDKGGCACRYKVAFEGNRPRVQDDGWGIENLCPKHAFLLRENYEVSNE
jgi:hypothetical protein